MSTHAEAIDILNTVRRTLTDRLADAVVRNKRHLLDGANVEGNPFSQHRGLNEMIVGLGHLDTAVAALRAFSGECAPPEQPADRSAPGLGQPPRGYFDFRRFTELVAVGRLEEAARELALIFQMPHDRMITATRFYDRAVRADPTIARHLENLPARLQNASSAQCMSLMVKTFGFQAVETRNAVQALQHHNRTTLRAASPMHPVGAPA